MKEHKINSKHDFIQGYYLSDLSICDSLIKIFNGPNTKKVRGEVGSKDNFRVDKNIKDSLDLQLRLKDAKNLPILKSYYNEIVNCLDLYKEKYKFCNKEVAAWGLEEGFNIQKYKPSEGYHKFHCESSNIGTSKRHLVYMTYLNDVKKGGETEWYYQKLKIKPEKGLTVIWTADWTFTHKGHTTIDEDKYIITGWFEFKK
jgi:hypothetical protein